MLTEYEITDRNLVTKILNGDRFAYGLLIKNTEGLVAQIVFKLIPVPADRKDLAQDIYLKVYKNLSGFRFQCKLSTWIGQVAYNTCLHYLKKKRLVTLGALAGEVHTEDQLDRMMAKNQPELAEVEEKLHAKELTQILASALSQLDPLYQTLIGLYYQQELSLLEIAEITELPEGTIKSYLFRARKELKQILLRLQKREGR